MYSVKRSVKHDFLFCLSRYKTSTTFISSFELQNQSTMRSMPQTRFIICHLVSEFFPCESLSIYVSCLIVFLGFFLHVHSQDFRGSPWSNLISIDFEEAITFCFLWKQCHNLSTNTINILTSIQ